MNKAAILRRILYRLTQDRLRIIGSGIQSPKVLRALFDAENDIYQIA